MSKSNDTEEERKKFILKNEKMIRDDIDPIAKERKEGGKPNKKYGLGGGGIIQKVKDKWFSMKEKFSSFKREGFTPDDAEKRMKQGPSEEDKEKGTLGAKFTRVGLDILITLVTIAIAIYVSSSWLQLTRAFKDHRMFSSLNPNKTPYTAVGSAQGEDKYNYSILSSKRFEFPYNLRDRINEDTWMNTLLDHFRDTWIYAKQNGDWMIGMLAPFSLLADTRNYKEKEKSGLHSIFEFIVIMFWLPILVPLIFIFGATLIPIYSSIKSFFQQIKSDDFPWFTTKIIPLWLFSWIGTSGNILIMPIYLLYFILIRPYNFMTKGGIKDWAQYLIGKYYIWIFVYAMFITFMSIINHFKDEKIQPMLLSITGVLTIFMLLLVWFEKIPSKLGRVDSKGNPVAFRIPAEEKLNTFRYPKPATMVVKKAKSAASEGHVNTNAQVAA